MNKDIEKIILEICPNKELKEALAFGNLELAQGTLMVELGYFDYYSTDSQLFMELYDKIYNSTLADLKTFVLKQKDMYYTSLAKDVLFYYMMANEYALECNDFVVSQSEEIEDKINKMMTYQELKKTNLDSFLNQLQQKKDNSFRIVECVKTTFNIPVVEFDAMAKNNLADYILKMIKAMKPLLIDVFDSISKNEPNILLERVALEAYLRSRYRKLKMSALEDRNKSDDEMIKMFGIDIESFDSRIKNDENEIVRDNVVNFTRSK